jgi:large subunit ribosomal protein L22
MSIVKAELNRLRIAPRKVRAVVGLLRGKTVNEALNQLEFMTKRSVHPIKKLINSAVANAENNFNMVKDNLYIKSFYVDEDIKLKRYRPNSRGVASPIQKKTSHIRIILDEKVAGMRREKTKAVEHEDRKNKEEEIKTQTLKDEMKKPEIRKEIGPRGNVLTRLGKRIFQRKAV